MKVFRPLTVLQVVPELEMGGVERGTVEVAKELVRRGHRSLVASAGGRMVSQLESLGTRHFQLPLNRKSPGTLRSILPLRRLIQREQVDILHVRSRLPAWIAWFVWRSLPSRSRPRLVTTVHGLYSANRYSRIMTRGEAVVAVSDAARDYIVNSYPDADASSIEVIHRGVAAADFPHGFRADAAWMSSFDEEFPATLGKQLLTLPGRLVRLKGHSTFLRLIARLRAEGHPVHGLIVGGVSPSRREYAASIHDQCAKLGLESDVTFTGGRSDIREIFSISSVVLSLSAKPESFGRTVLESLNLGIPVVGYDHGGVGEILSNVWPMGATPKDDFAALYDRVATLLRDKRLEVPPVTEYQLSTMLDKTIQLYERLAA